MIELTKPQNERKGKHQMKITTFSCKLLEHFHDITIKQELAKPFQLWSKLTVTRPGRHSIIVSWKQYSLQQTQMPIKIHVSIDSEEGRLNFPLEYTNPTEALKDVKNMLKA